MTEGRKQMTEYGRQRTDDRRKKTDGRKRETEIHSGCGLRLIGGTGSCAPEGMENVEFGMKKRR